MDVGAFLWTQSLLMLTRQSQHAKFKYGWNLVLLFLFAQVRRNAAWSILQKQDLKSKECMKIKEMEADSSGCQCS